MGSSDSSAIAARFIEYQKMGLSKNVYLDSIVCVADADIIYVEFLDDLKDADSPYTEQNLGNTKLDCFHREKSE